MSGRRGAGLTVGVKDRRQRDRRDNARRLALALTGQLHRIDTAGAPGTVPCGYPAGTGGPVTSCPGGVPTTRNMPGSETHAVLHQD